MNSMKMMGKVVFVREVYRRRHGPEPLRRTWERRPLYVWRPDAGRPGWVVGARQLQNGMIVPGGHEEGTYLKETEPRVTCLLVCFHSRAEPVKVPLDGWEETKEEPYFMSKGLRNFLSEESAQYERDERGRFTGGLLP